MSHRHELRDPRWEEQREREIPDVERDAEAPFGRDAGDPRWGTGGMRGDERPHRPPPPEVNERLAPGAFSRAGVRPSQSHGAGEGVMSTPPYHHHPLEPYPTARGPYVGRAPRGYRRSDGHIREDVCERFTEHGDLDPTDVEVSVHAGEVTLVGAVATRAQKRLAEDIVVAVSGVVEVHNHLRVQRTADDWRALHGAAPDEESAARESSATDR
jgi:hypothetical protein